MTGQLRVSGDDDGAARCVLCGALAAGPCARCRRPICGGCAVLTEGGATTFAICTSCDRRGGRSLARAWLALLAWILVPVLVLAGAALLLVTR